MPPVQGASTPNPPLSHRHPSLVSLSLGFFFFFFNSSSLLSFAPFANSPRRSSAPLLYHYNMSYLGLICGGVHICGIF